MANKVIGSIPYSLSLRPVSPGNTESEKKIFPTIQSRETVTLKMLAQHIREHGSSFSVGTLYGVLADMVECTKEMLMSGYRVSLDGLASFYLTGKAKAVDSVDDFNPSQITLSIRTEVDAEARAYVNTNPEFEYVMTREEQANAKKAAKAALPQASASEGGNTGGSGNQGGSGGNTGGGDVTE